MGPYIEVGDGTVGPTLDRALVNSYLRSFVTVYCTNFIIF